MKRPKLTAEERAYFDWEHQNMKFVAKMSIAGDYTLDLVFEDGVEKVIDLHPFLFHPDVPQWYWPLRDLAFFNRVFLDNGHVTWPDRRDLHPPLLYTWEGESWRAWLDEKVGA